MSQIPPSQMDHLSRRVLSAALASAYSKGDLRFEALPQEALAFVEARTPRGSAWDTLLLLAHREALGLGLLKGEGFELPGGATFALISVDDLPSPSPVVLLFPQAYFDLLTTDDLAAHLAFAFAAHLLPPPTSLDPATFAQGRAAALLGDHGVRGEEASAELIESITAMERAGDWAGLLRVLGDYRLGDDPDGLMRAPLNNALSALLPVVPLGEVLKAGLLRPYYRAALEIPSFARACFGGDVLQGLAQGLKELGVAPLDAGLFEVNLGGEALPLPELALPLEEWGYAPLGDARGVEALGPWILSRGRGRLEGEGALVVGIIAPGGAGKTTLARGLGELFEGAGHRVAYLGADAYLWPGNGFRYLQKGGDRETWLRGPGIYLSEALGADLRALRRGGTLEIPADPKAGLEARRVGPVDIVITEGVFMGLDPRVRGEVDVLIGLNVAPDTQAPRFGSKHARDTGAQSVRRINVPRDFAEKIFQESEDGILPVLEAHADGIYCRERGEIWVRPQQ